MTLLFTGAGDSIFVVGSYRARHRESGKSFLAPVAHLYDLANGNIARLRQFTDTKVICDALS